MSEKINSYYMADQYYKIKSCLKELEMASSDQKQTRLNVPSTKSQS